MCLSFYFQKSGMDLSQREAAMIGGGSTEVPGVMTAYSKGSAASYKKLSRFFGEAPPRVEDLESLLEELDYLHLLPVCQTIA